MKETLGDKLNRIEEETIAKYKALMGEMPDSEACNDLSLLFKESIPMRELEEMMSITAPDSTKI